MNSNSIGDFQRQRSLNVVETTIDHKSSQVIDFS